MAPTPRRSRLVAPAALVLLAAVGVRPGLGQEPRHTIENFRAVDVSNEELRVTVLYTFTGTPGETDVTIRATPEESGGIFDPRTVHIEAVPVERGTHSATLTIRKRAGAREFTSAAITVCIATRDRALLCRDFPHAKTWTDADAQPVSPLSAREGPGEPVATPGRDADPPDVWDYAGYWTRSTARQNYIVYVAIRPVTADRMTVHAWGRCEKSPEEGGTRADCEYWKSAETTLRPSGAASLVQPVLQEPWDLRLSEAGDRLNVRNRQGRGWAREQGVDLALTPFPDGDVCTVRGLFTGRAWRRANRVSFRTPSGPEVERAEVARRFTVQLVEGTYVVAPAAAGKLSVTSKPRGHIIRCAAGEAYELTFEIVSVSG